jgi:hypothetical protein
MDRLCDGRVRTIQGVCESLSVLALIRGPTRHADRVGTARRRYAMWRGPNQTFVVVVDPLMMLCHSSRRYGRRSAGGIVYEVVRPTRLGVGLGLALAAVSRKMETIRTKQECEAEHWNLLKNNIASTIRT